MTLFLDTAKVSEIEKALDFGIINGLTTNPSIMLKSGVKYSKESYYSLISEICDLVQSPVSVELTNTKGTIEDLINEAQDLWEIDRNYITIKVPMWGDGKGLSLISELTTKGIMVNATCLMSASQAILAMEAGARYVSLFYNRILDYNEKKLSAVEDAFGLAHTYLLGHGGNWDPPCEIIAGSIRKSEDVPRAFVIGADIVTVPFNILMAMIQHKKTDETILEFDKAWEEFVKIRDG